MIEDWIVLKNAPAPRTPQNERRYIIPSTVKAVSEFGLGIIQEFEKLYGDPGGFATYAIAEMAQNYAKDALKLDPEKNVHVMTFDWSGRLYAFLGMDPTAPDVDYDAEKVFAGSEARNFDLTRNSGRGSFICQELADIILIEQNKRGMTLVFDLHKVA
jgi:anti-sigma regulatory factor (Ser/Thr protein kinase)